MVFLYSCLCHDILSVTAESVHSRQTSRDVNVDFLVNKLAGFIPADCFPWQTRVHFDMPPRSSDCESSVATSVCRKIYISCESLAGGRQVSNQRATKWTYHFPVTRSQTSGQPLRGHSACIQKVSCQQVINQQAKCATRLSLMFV